MTITATTEITESDSRATRLAILEARVVDARGDVHAAVLSGDLAYGLDAVESLATLLQHTLQEIAHLASKISPR